MAGVRCLLLAAVLGAAVPRASAVSTKVVVAQIQCAVCKLAVKELRQQAKAKLELVEDEDVLVDAIENLCTATKDEGKWITKIDVMQKQSGALLSLDRRDVEGVCQNECKSVQRACSAALKGKDESLVSLIRDSAGVGQLQREVCKKACAKKVPELSQDYADEAWKPAMAPAPPVPPAPSMPNAPSGITDIVIPPRLSEIVPELLDSAFVEFGSSPAVDNINECFNEFGAFKQSGEDFLEDTLQGTKEMLKKNADAMRSGLATVARGVANLTATFEKSCKPSPHALQMKALAEKLNVYAEDASEVEYKAMETLKVHGHDIHKLLNSFIAAWKQEPADGKAIGKALGKLIKAFEDNAGSEAAKTEL